MVLTGQLIGKFGMLAESGYVEFPNIFKNTGLRFNINDVAFTLFGWEIRWYGLLISAAVVLSLALGLTACKKYGIEQNDLLDYMIFALPAAIIGARLYYVIFNFDVYRDNLLSVFHYWEGGLAVYGGVLGGAIAILIVARVKKQKVLKIVDFVIPYVALSQGIGRWGNFFNQEAFGGRTTLPWGMTGDRIEVFVRNQGWPAGSLVHPTFLYESLWCLLTFAVIIIFRRKTKKLDAECSAIYMMMYGLERMLVEGLRTDSLYIGNTGIRVSQLLSAILVILGITLFIDLRRRARNSIYSEDADTEGGKVETGFETAVALTAKGAGENAETAEIAENAETSENAETAEAPAAESAVDAEVAEKAAEAVADDGQTT